MKRQRDVDEEKEEKGEKDHFNTLPNEILLYIIKDLSTIDIVSLKFSMLYNRKGAELFKKINNIDWFKFLVGDREEGCF